jgi:Holliday junction resolvase RusA-like endonuclease
MTRAARAAIRAERPQESECGPKQPESTCTAPHTVQRLVLPDFPSPEIARTLSPNGRAHWRERKRAGGVVYEHVMAALAVTPLAPMLGRVVLSPTFVYPVQRRRDDDNLATGVMKVVRDALVARGILADDSTRHVRQEPVRVIVEKGQRRLEIELAPASRGDGG